MNLRHQNFLPCFDVYSESVGGWCSVHTISKADGFSCPAIFYAKGFKWIRDSTVEKISSIKLEQPAELKLTYTHSDNGSAQN